MARVSVVIPAFNREGCVGRALESVRAQGIGELEVVLGDDASTDGTVEAAHRAFPGLQVVRLGSNSGAAAARNAAIEKSSGNFLAFLDSDDEWMPGKLAAQLDFLEANPGVAACGCQHVFRRRDGVAREVRVSDPGDWRMALHSGQPFHGASTPVARRGVLDSVGLQDASLRVLEDWDWMLRISQKHRIHVLPAPLAVVHENGPSDPAHTLRSTEWFLQKHAADFFSFGEAHRRRVESQHWENAARCFFRHSLNRGGMALAWRSLLASPWRNPALGVAFPLAFFDAAAGTKMLRRLLRLRGGYSVL